MFYFFMEYLCYPTIIVLMAVSGSLMYYRGQYDVNTQLATIAKNKLEYKLKTPSAKYVITGYESHTDNAGIHIKQVN